MVLKNTMSDFVQQVSQSIAVKTLITVISNTLVALYTIFSMILAEEITALVDKFTAEASENGSAYDVYVRDKFDDIVATIEVKTTQDKTGLVVKKKLATISAQ